MTVPAFVGDQPDLAAPSERVDWEDSERAWQGVYAFAQYRRDLEQYVYFIQAVNGGPIKIGFSVNPLLRLRELQLFSPFRLVILAVLPGPQRLETELHRIFVADRLHGEWFRVTPDLYAVIRAALDWDETVEYVHDEWAALDEYENGLVA